MSVSVDAYTPASVQAGATGLPPGNISAPMFTVSREKYQALQRFVIADACLHVYAVDQLKSCAKSICLESTQINFKSNESAPVPDTAESGRHGAPTETHRKTRRTAAQRVDQERDLQRQI